jgi:hypothetical protein
MVNSLIDYLPVQMQQIEELRQIMSIETTDINALASEIQKVFQNQFISTANEDGVVKYESILKILPKAADTIEERRFRILLRYRERAFYTLPAVTKQIESICGAGEYTVTLDSANYTLDVKIALTSRSNFDEVDNLLKRVRPCNLIINVSLKYNQHQTLAAFMHGALQRYTHDGLRNEVITSE